MAASPREPADVIKETAHYQKSDVRKLWSEHASSLSWPVISESRHHDDFTALVARASFHSGIMCLATEVPPPKYSAAYSVSKRPEPVEGASGAYGFARAPA